MTKTFRFTLFAGVMAALLCLCTRSSEARADHREYWDNHWNWHNNHYTPYYNNYYGYNRGYPNAYYGNGYYNNGYYGNGYYGNGYNSYYGGYYGAPGAGIQVGPVGVGVGGWW